MAFVSRTLRKIRNNWKKSTFAAVVLTYGYNWTENYVQTQELMRIYCEKASNFGRQHIPENKTPRTVTVILNPNANKRSAVDEFEKYCAPIFHLAGFLVNIVKTESEGHARKLVQDLNNTDAIIVAGGDGTLCEVVTGLLRRTGENNTGLVPIGILPLGRNNTLAKSLFPGGHHLQKVKSLVDASMAVVEESTKLVDVMKVEISENGTEDDPKPIYALCNIKWGAYRDAEVLKEKYWYYGSFRKYATYIFNGLKDSLTWKINANLAYSPPCEGCSNCSVKKERQTNQKWFQRFSKENIQNNKYARVLNPECATMLEKKVETSDLVISTSNISSNNSDIPKLHLSIGPKSISYLDFVKQGWSSEKGNQRKFEENLDARSMVIEPQETWSEEKGLWFSIDNDEFEVKPIKITLVPKFIPMFCKKESL
ncbi:acylglycerol kinase, mitochondrial [Coccinella septempunctata]|uniref:acylglycerol kinase, mitochondrial n=1 Tax=Coccinella septempunctata TaxID=41139 RepID=UPI001D079D6F|nr:acylglycerol kinase, mitochondrial [Coccinella septempunctata]XP_044744895.1 acylglycerol kinase, mitochondrial [Coccinella septempunctata]